MNYFIIRDSISGFLWGNIIGIFLRRKPCKLRIVRPRKFVGLSNMIIGNNVYIASNCWLQTHGSDSELILGDKCCIGNNCHIYSLKRIQIGEEVLLADNVYLSDNLHNYNDVNKAVLSQSIKQIGTVNIGRGSWIGENVAIIGASIGNNCVIGANAVVTKDIPPYCVVVGAPAKIIKRYSLKEREWLATDINGEFI